MTPSAAAWLHDELGRVLERHDAAKAAIGAEYQALATIRSDHQGYRAFVMGIYLAGGLALSALAAVFSPWLTVLGIVLSVLATHLAGALNPRFNPGRALAHAEDWRRHALEQEQQVFLEAIEECVQQYQKRALAERPSGQQLPR
jgi:hypothetical protein